MAAEADQVDVAMGGVSPRDKTTMQQTIERSLGAMNTTLNARADADAQTTVTDFLDFTEYLPSDMVRSLTLIGKLDQAYTDASIDIDELTTTWGKLPTLAPADRPSPVQLRADISEKLSRAVSSRVYAHSEALRMRDNVHRHYHKATVLLAKLQAMMDNYPTEEQRSPVASRSPQLTRAKLTVRAGGESGGQKSRRQRVPRITVPGEVLAPYDIEYDTFSDESESSSDDESEAPGTSRRTPGPAPRIKLVNKTPKSASRPPRPTQTPVALSAAAAANAAALLQPPPENAVIGSQDAPWLQLTDYELAKLRKRMKKNATWTPSETMIARELKLLNRGPDAYREAKKKAEDEGKTFEPTVPAAIAETESGTPQLPAGAISVESVSVEDLPTSNRGMKLNEAKKLKRETLAKLAAEEAEESARKMAEQAKAWLGTGGAVSESSKDSVPTKARPNPRSNNKRRRDDTDSNEGADGAETPSTSVPQIKRTKTETPVLPPQHIAFTRSNLTSQDSMLNPALLTPGGTVKSVTPQTQTPVPIPIPPQGSSKAASRSATSPTPIPSVASTITTSVPVKPPAETPVPLPIMDRRKSATPVTPPVRETPVRETIKRETRGDAAKRTHLPPSQAQQGQQTPVDSARRSSSRGATPRITPVPEASRRPGSRGKAMSQEPQPSLAVERPRRASTARNTPAPEARPNKRTKRPAPGIVSTTNSGGNSAVGKRKAPPKKKARLTKKEKGQIETEMEEVDDEGNAISPDEARYCSCNRVSFGVMIQCDNVDNCKQEWFHLPCVGLNDIPARTTKWYCPDCRKALNLGEKGEINARGIRK